MKPVLNSALVALSKGLLLLQGVMAVYKVATNTALRIPLKNYIDPVRKWETAVR